MDGQITLVKNERVLDFFPGELELLVATLMDRDAIDGKGSVSLLAECSSTVDVNTSEDNLGQKISNVVPTPRNPKYAVSNPWIRPQTTKWQFSGMEEKEQERVKQRLGNVRDSGGGRGVREERVNWCGNMRFGQVVLKCMTRSSTNKLFTLYKEPEREFRSFRRHFKTLSLDELRSPDFNLLFDQEYSEEELAKTMAETMEQYMSKTRADYGSGVARPKIKDRDNFELKGQFLKELYQVMLRAFPMSLTGAASRWLRNKPTGSITTWEDLKTKFLSKYCPPACTAKKMEEINNFQQEPDENLYQAWERFKELLMKCPQHYLTEMQEVVLFYNGLDVPTRQILDSRGAIPSKTAADAKIAIQEMAEYSQKWHNGTSRVRSTETSDGLAAIQAQLNNLGREIKKVNEKVYAAQVGCEQCKGPYYTKDCPLKEEGKTLEEAYYTQFGGPFQGGGYRATTPGYYQRNNANPSYQERRQSMEDTLSKFMSESTKRHEENSNLIKEIRAATDAAIRNQGASIKTLEIQIGQMSKVLQQRGFRIRPSSTETNPRDQVKSISTTIEADSYSIHRIRSSQYAVSTGQNSTLLYKSRQTTVSFPSRLDNHYCEEEEGNYGPKFVEAYGASHINDTIPQKEKDPRSELAHTKLTVELADRTVKYPKGIAENVLVRISKFTFPVDFIILDMPEDIKVPLILRRLFLSTARAMIDVYKRKITLRVEEENIIFTSVKPSSSLIKRVYMLSLRERMELDLEARLMGETLVLNRSLDPFLEDYIELNDLNEPFELRRNQGDDLMPTIEEGEVIEEFRTRDEDLDTRIYDYPSYCENDKKIHIDYAHNLKFSCMIGFEFTHVNFFPLLYVNGMSKKFHNSIMKDKMVYKGNNVVGTLMNVPIFVGTFLVVTDFAVLENMDAYRDEGNGDVIIGEPF
ncbi:DNA-directed DNA polymerase, partial [Tanacetum coccineum]